MAKMNVDIANLCTLLRAIAGGSDALSAAADGIEQLAAEREEARKALAFYADPKRYDGPNQRLDDGEVDEWTVAGSYRQDVTRDCGSIARKALGG